MNILIIGNGGREHTLAWKIKESPQCGQLYVAPGNAGTTQCAQNVPINVEEFEKLGHFCLQKNIELVVVGPELPLVKGIRDYFEAHPDLSNIPMVGPGKLGAQLEGSKDFSKQFMLRHQIPTAQAQIFLAHQSEQALRYLKTTNYPIVLKADGLAAGKGVIIASNLAEAQLAVQEMLEKKKFGDAANKILIEQYLKGIELSVFVLTDGEHYVILPEAKDYKRIGNNDTGLNTGGMGSVSPVHFANKEFMRKVEAKIIGPTIKGLKKENIPFRGFIFIGLMNVSGEPYVIEYNTRMGDPETQSVLMRIQNDFLSLLVATAKGELGGHTLKSCDEYVLTVVMASGGYPEEYEKGKVIRGLNDTKSAEIFHAGTTMKQDKVVTNGGRVLTVTAKGKTLAEAQQQAYSAVHAITWDQAYYRTDIGNDVLHLMHEKENGY